MSCNSKKGLNDTEQRAYNTIVRRFLQEWTLSKDIQDKEARKKLNQFLQESRTKGKQKQSSSLIHAVIVSKKNTHRR